MLAPVTTTSPETPLPRLAPEAAGAALRPGLSPRGKLALALTTVYLIWGSTYLAMHWAIADIPPFLMGGIRFTLAGAILLAVARVRGAAWPTLREWRNAGVIGVLFCLGGNGLVAIAQQDIDSGLTAVVVATMPLWLAVFSALAGARPRPREWIGLAVGLAGVAVLASGDGLGASPGAAVLLVVSPIAWAYGSFLMPRLALPAGLGGPGAQMLVGGLSLLVGALVRGESMTEAPSTESVLALLYLLVFGSLVAFTAFTWLVHHARPAVASSYAYVNPGIAVLLGVVLAGEPFGMELVVAGPLIVGSVMLIVLGRGRR
ncbi:MAG: drug/metabolite exporter YedA [Deltaproteobacteria bacterium]|nr:drug/metabolite exporter YedA [Deltaproteobacteria bacterium]